MKKIILALTTLALAGATIQTASAGDREWATAGKVLTGVVAASVISQALQPQPAYYDSSYYSYGPSYGYSYAPPPRVVYAPPPVVVYRPPVYVAPPVVSFSFGYGGYRGGYYGGHHRGYYGGYHGYSNHHRRGCW
jgi:hypothetical protein